MNRQSPIVIASHHRNRLAVVYVRTATVQHGLEDLARLDYQRAQVRHARAWGWPERAIQVIEDIGRSGSSAKGRPGWQRLLDLVRQGGVGLVLVSDLSRLSRSEADLQMLLDLCEKAKTLRLWVRLRWLSV